MSIAEEIKIPMDDTYLNVIRFGHGSKNMVMIAGVTLIGMEGQGEGVAAAFAQFADAFTVYLFERRKVLPEGFTVEDMAEDIYCALRQLGVESACVYGASQGGMIAQCLAVRYPRLVEKLVLCSTQCRATERMKAAVEQWLQLAAQKDVVAINRCFFEMVYSAAFLESVKDLLPALEKVGTEEDCARFAILAEACQRFDIADKMEKIACPVLVIGGEDDRVIGPEGSRDIVEHLHCDCIMYDAGSHAVYDENPAVKEEMFRFFQEAQRCR